MLSMYINSTHTNWDEILPYVTFAYNSSRQESTGRTPFYLTYGREARLPVDVAIGARPSIGSNDPLLVARNLETAREEVRTRLEQIQERQKELYDAKHREALEFIPGQEVLVYKPFRKVGRSEKLLHRWIGPYVVVRRASALNYEVKKPRGKQKELAHVVRIKRFVRNGEWTVTENGQNNEMTGVTERTVPRPLEKSSGYVGAATQVETGRPKNAKWRPRLTRYNRRRLGQVVARRWREPHCGDLRERGGPRTGSNLRVKHQQLGLFFCCWAYSDPSWGYSRAKECNAGRL
jgi:hypothetical protein